jgi:hypothetical protein
LHTPQADAENPVIYFAPVSRGAVLCLAWSIVELHGAQVDERRGKLS